MLDPDLSFAHVRAHFAAAPPHAIAGTTRRSCDCPLATMYREEGYKHAGITLSMSYLDESVFPTPKWMLEAIGLIDALYDTPTDVTNETVLHILDGLPEELKR